MPLAGWQHALVYFENRCAYCGAGDAPMTVDHFIPRALGGTSHDSNIVPACDSCNRSKDAKHPKEFCRPDTYWRIADYLLSFNIVTSRTDSVLSDDMSVREVRRTTRWTWHGWFRRALEAKRLEPERIAKQLGVSRKEIRGYWFGRFDPPDRIKRQIAAALMDEVSQEYSRGRVG